MSDLPSALGIEAVEFVADAGRSVTVRVTGRWRRRRPELRGQAVLVVDTGPVRQRFVAMPEPPSLIGAAPGTWRMSFTVPAELASQLPGKTFLQLGAVTVPLPLGDAALVGGEVASPAALHARVPRIEDELMRAREESSRLRDVIADRERRLRSSEQHVHAERARRTEIEQELTDNTRAAGHKIHVLDERVAELERELARLRRAVDEAEHLAAAAEAGRADAEHRLAQRPPPGPPPPPAPAPAPAEPPPELADARSELADVRRELGDARCELERQRLLCERAYDAIDLVRRELSRLGDVPGQPAPAPPPPPPGLVQAERLSAALARLRDTAPAAPEAPGPETAGPVAAPGQPPAEQPGRPAKPWLGKTFRMLAARDPSSAGRLLLALLPAQRAADPQPVAYDLVLGDLAAARVTVSSGSAQVDLGDAPRPLTEVDFQLVGDPASIARLLAAGPLRRRLGRLVAGGRMARVRGDRRRLRALERLLDAPLTLSGLHAAGVRLDPVLALTVAGLMIEPGWTAEERFTIAHLPPSAPSPDAYLHIRDARTPIVTEEPPHGPVATTIACQPDGLLAVLAGEQVADAAIGGDQRPLALIRRWLDRAQCG